MSPEPEVREVLHRDGPASKNLEMLPNALPTFSRVTQWILFTRILVLLTVVERLKHASMDMLKP